MEITGGVYVDPKTGETVSHAYCGKCPRCQVWGGVMRSYRMPEEEIRAAEARGDHLLTEITEEYHHLGTAPGWFESLGVVPPTKVILPGDVVAELGGADQARATAERLMKAKALLEIGKTAPILSPEGIAQADEWFRSSYIDGLALLGFTAEERHTRVCGDGVALTSISHPDGSLLAAELAAEAEEIWAEENPDLSAITRDIARGE